MPVKREFIQPEWGNRHALLGRLLVLAVLVGCLVVVSQQYDENEKPGGRAGKRVQLDPDYIPSQTDLMEMEPLTFFRPDYTWRVVPRAGYQISARVLQSTRYDDWQAGISPLDLALGWGMMSDPAVDEWVEVRQQDRWYFYRKQHNSPLSMEDIRNSSANVHIIPANEAVAALIQTLRPNDMVLMEGKLVDVEVDRMGERIHFQTSLTRSDSDDNSCEIFFVERVIVETGGVR